MLYNKPKVITPTPAIASGRSYPGGDRESTQPTPVRYAIEGRTLHGGRQPNLLINHLPMTEISEQKQINPWDYKPWWCQPWSILLTGIAIISTSWFLFKTLWIAIIVSVPVLTWMGFFLLIWPSLMRNMLKSYQESPTVTIPPNRGLN